MEVLTPLLHKLSLLLAEDDSLAAKHTDPIAALLKGSAVEKDFHLLGRLAAQYDFEAALESLHDSAGKLGVQLV